MRQAKQLGHVVDAFKESITTNDEKVNQMQSGITAHLLHSHIVTYCFLFFLLKFDVAFEMSKTFQMYRLFL